MVDIKQIFTMMVGIFVVTVLAFTWFFPTLNGATALNNSSTLWLGGVNYSWAVPVIAVLLIVGLLYVYIKNMGD